MKFIEWFIRAATFAIHTGMISFGFYVLLQGFEYQIWEAEAIGLVIIFAGMMSIATTISEKTREFIYG